MKVDILRESGYCYGVENAIRMALSIKQSNPNKNIYVLGMLVHNDFVCDYLEKVGIKTLNYSPLDYENALHTLRKGDIVIFTAHGHDERLDSIAKDLDLVTYDAVCPMVLKNLKLIKKALNENKKVIYVGQENHPEAIAATSLSDSVMLIPNNLLNINQITTNKDIFVINQTTLNYSDLIKLHQEIKHKFPNSTIANEVCAATRLRQESIMNLDKTYEALIVCGSHKSSNTNKLYDIALKHHPNILTLRCEGLNDLNLSLLKGKKKVAITGGTSTPLEVLQLIKNELINVN